MTFRSVTILPVLAALGTLGCASVSHHPYPDQARIGEWIDDEKVAAYLVDHSTLPPLLREPLGRRVRVGSAFWVRDEPPPPNTYLFYCTLYYTPRESGFTAERGFDMTLETRPGLGGRKYPRDFLRAVKKEGVGKIAVPVHGRHYLAYGRPWKYLKAPLGNRANALVPRRSAALKSPHPVAGAASRLSIYSREIAEVFGNTEWSVDDTGGGLNRWQIDLYWGEDDPRGPGRNIARPRGIPFQYAFDVPVAIR